MLTEKLSSLSRSEGHQLLISQYERIVCVVNIANVVIDSRNSLQRLCQLLNRFQNFCNFAMILLCLTTISVQYVWRKLIDVVIYKMARELSYDMTFYLNFGLLCLDIWICTYFDYEHW